MLELFFSSDQPGTTLNITATEPPSLIDTIELSPSGGAYPWLLEQQRTHRYTPDYTSLVKLEPDKPVTLRLVLNDVYRFDSPGHFTVRVRTRRISASGEQWFEHPQELVTNEASFCGSRIPGQ